MQKVGNFMFRIGFLILIVLLSPLHSNAFEQDVPSLTKINFDWYVKNKDSIHDILHKKNDRSLIPSINIIGDIWIHRDGAIGSEVAPTVAIALIEHPDLMLVWFAAHPDQYQAWLNELPYVLLTDYDGGHSDTLKKTKTDIIRSLQQFVNASENAHFQEMAKKMLRKLEITKIREMD